MKTFITTCIFAFLISFSSFAQLGKGYWLGSVEGSLAVTGSRAYWTINMNPQLMKLVHKNLAVGLGADFSYFKSNSTYFNGTTNLGPNSDFNLEIGPVARKYFGNSKLKPYVELGTGILMYKWNYENAENSGMNETHYKYYLNPTIGLSYWMNDRVSINLSTGYDILNFKEVNSTGIKIGVSFKLGK
jgi:hypothetical protein